MGSRFSCVAMGIDRVSLDLLQAKNKECGFESGVWGCVEFILTG